MATIKERLTTLETKVKNIEKMLYILIALQLGLEGVSKFII